MEKLLGRSPLLLGALSQAKVEGLPRARVLTIIAMTLEPFHLPFPATRGEALDALFSFAPKAAQYGKRRNYVEADHGNVSSLSPAVSCRLLDPRELAQAAIEFHGDSTTEIWQKEVYWRQYWKGWLELRPSIWAEYDGRRRTFDRRTRDLADKISRGEGPVAIMNYFAKELRATGYLHNHARMWFASYWVHVERLPWELGAQFFYSELLDADAASNTLSWRWVAGLHTEGKEYLVRLSNLETYMERSILDAHNAGEERLRAPKPAEIDFTPHPSPRKLLNESSESLEKIHESGCKLGLWIHEDDLMLEESPLKDTSPEAVLAVIPKQVWGQHHYSEHRSDYLRHAMADAAERSTRHFRAFSGTQETIDAATSLVEWAKEHGLTHIASTRPYVGPIADLLPEVQHTLADAGISLVLPYRDWELDLFQHATGGFFKFYKKSERLRTGFDACR